jgi:hypothetical protein
MALNGHIEASSRLSAFGGKADISQRSPGNLDFRVGVLALVGELYVADISVSPGLVDARRSGRAVMPK